ncbi:MAG: PEP-CTERM sorting domain-containing protein [Planctomycetota bacterium]
MKKVLGTLAIAALAGGASAQVTSFSFTPTVSGDGTAVSNEIAVDFTGQYTGSQILLELTQGTILQEQAFGSDVDVAPGEGLANAAGGLLFDTYVAQGSRFSDGPGAIGAPNLGGGAVNIRTTDAGAVFNDPTTISQAYNPPGGLLILDGTNFVIAQIALSSDAQGTFKFFASANDEVPAIDDIEEFVINNGVIEIPEPASAALLGLGGLAMLRRRSA